MALSLFCFRAGVPQRSCQAYAIRWVHNAREKHKARDMLAKSKRSSFIMASIATFSYFLTNFLFNLANHYVTTGNFPSIREEINNIHLSWNTFLIFIVTLFIMVALGGLLIHSLFSSDIHFGVSGVIRWSLFSMTDVVLARTYPLIWTTLSYTLRELIELAIVPISYIIAFKIYPFSRQNNKSSI